MIHCRTKVPFRRMLTGREKILCKDCHEVEGNCKVLCLGWSNACSGTGEGRRGEGGGSKQLKRNFAEKAMWNLVGI